MMPSDYRVIYNYGLLAGETFEERLLKIENGVATQRHWTSKTSSTDCKEGCGAISGGSSLATGDYILEISNSAQKGITSVSFTVKPNETLVWMVSDKHKPFSFRADNRTKTLQDKSPYRLDLLAVFLNEARLEKPKPRYRDIKRVPASFPLGHPEARKNQ
jgi:hypothetical protein